MKKYIILLTASVLTFSCFAQRATVNRNGITPYNRGVPNTKGIPKYRAKHAHSSIKFLRMSLRLPRNWRIVKPNTVTVVTNITVVTNKPTTQQQQGGGQQGGGQQYGGQQQTNQTPLVIKRIP